MMLGDMARWQEEKHLYPSAVQQGIDYILATDFTMRKDDRYAIQGDLMFALLQSPTTRPFEQQRPESHRVHTDIQFLLEGTELFGTARLDERQPVAEDAMEERDLAFYRDVHSESRLLLLPGMFVVVFPTDIHRPNGSATNMESKLRKVVIKIHSSLLEAAD